MIRIGVYVGSWTLTRLGGMGTYLRELLGGVRRLGDADAETVLLVDRSNVSAARELDAGAPLVRMDRPVWTGVPPDERRRVIDVRRLSYRDAERADARRLQTWSEAAEAYLWGLDDACAGSAIDVLYFTIPPYIKRPRAPFVVTVHDLKHVHRPRDHDRRDLARRRRWGRVARAAECVVSSYEHIRRDVVRHMGVDPARARVLPVAPPNEVRRAAPNPQSWEGVALPERFGLLPAQFWPHKNHPLVLLALHHLQRDRGLAIPIVCTGQTDGECASHFERMCTLARQLDVADLFLPLGHVSSDALRRLYDAATFVLAPTLYDPGSFPAMEALSLGRPVIASRVTSVPELVGDAGLLFDPHSVDELVEAMERLWTDEALRGELALRGPRRLPRRTWADVAREWIAVCREAAQSVPAPATA